MSRETVKHREVPHTGKRVGKEADIITRHNESVEKKGVTIKMPANGQVDD